MKINMISLNHTCEPGFELNLPNGTEDYLFVLFKCPTNVLVEDRMRVAKPNWFMFFDKDKPQKYAPCSGIFIHDYIRFEFDSDTEKKLYNNLPFNQLITCEKSVAIEKALQDLSVEFYGVSIYRTENINLLTKLFLSRVMEYLNTGTSYKNTESFSLQLSNLRIEIYRNPQNRWTVEHMARMCNLSRSYFQKVYKERYGISCINDVILARLERAKWFLQYTSHNIESIAAYCGYESVEHFVRQFRKICQITPLQYRKK